jgi:hypothetical protein
MVDKVFTIGLERLGEIRGNVAWQQITPTEAVEMMDRLCRHMGFCDHTESYVIGEPIQGHDPNETLQ